jgi:enterochelin esterase family protein
MAEDLLPWVHAHYHVSSEASRVSLCGASAGGLGAAYVAFRHPELFGNVLAQSGAFWRGNEGGSDPVEWLTAQFRSAPCSGLRFYLEVGALENHPTAGGPIFIETNRRLRGVLQAKGYEVRYVEVPGAVHEPGHWRQQLADGLLFLVGRHGSP